MDFPRMAEQYWDTVFRIALNYYGDPNDAEDTVQDVMLKLYKSDKCFENDEHVRNWLIRVTINSCKSTLRSFWRRNRVSLDDITESAAWDKPEQSELFAAVMSLNGHHRTILYLHYYEDFTTKEIAEMFGQSEAHIRTKLSRARKKLKEVWRNE